MRTPRLFLLSLAISSLVGLAVADEKAAQDLSIADKTLVAWVSPANLTQRGGSVLTLENPGGEFDAIVFGEKEPGKWMAGSNGFHRTESNLAAYPVETAAPGQFVQIAIAYRGQQVTIYRDGKQYAQYTMASKPVAFGKQCTALIGLRHRDAGTPRLFSGEVADARVYNTALDAAAIASLKPKELSEPKPVAWWTFENGKAEDRMNRFHATVLNNAKVVDGKLVLAGGDCYLIAGQQTVRTRSNEDWPTWHVAAWPEEGVAVPYDANGCIYWKGKYHLMYIFQNPKLVNGGHSWGHASSKDLVNWTFHPAALEPKPGDADTGIFSGNAFVNKEGKPMLCWFGIDAGVCVATAEDDDLIHWKKHPNNPIIPIPKKGEPGDGVYKVWDPYLWLEGDTYYCLLGGNTLANGKDTLYACKSKDLVHWEPLHPFYEHPDLTWTVLGEDCSCPDFFKLGDKRVLMCISHVIGARCYVGRFDKEKEVFLPEQHVRMNWPGGTFFAPESLEDAKGRRIFWAWVIDPRERNTRKATGSGVQSMPRVLSMAKDGTLEITPAEELQTLRRNPRTIEKTPLKPNEEISLPNIQGDSLELALEIDPAQAIEVGVKVRCSPDGKESTAIIYDAVAKMLKIDMTQSTLRDDVLYTSTPLGMAIAGRLRDGLHERNVVEAPLALKPGEPLKLRIFLDKSMLEVYANDRQCMTQQIFTESREATGIKVFTHGFQLNQWATEIRSGQAWDMAPAKFINEKGKND
jgi:sucrose-6-phosphate hydrolase SacC (GH32 family)